MSLVVLLNSSFFAIYYETIKRVLGMISWALGRIGGPKAKKALDDILPQSDGIVRKEILYALNMS